MFCYCLSMFPCYVLSMLFAIPNWYHPLHFSLHVCENGNSNFFDSTHLPTFFNNKVFFFNYIIFVFELFLFFFSFSIVVILFQICVFYSVYFFLCKTKGILAQNFHLKHLFSYLLTFTSIILSIL